MAKSQETYNKKEVRNRKEKKRKEKVQKRLDRRNNESKDGNDLDSMMAYVDEYGNITSEPPQVGFIKNKVKAEDIEISTPRQLAEAKASKTRTGKVSFFNDTKGYGFIIDDLNGQNLFVHINDTEDKLAQNSKVTFEIEKGIRGLKAVRVKLS